VCHRDCSWRAEENLLLFSSANLILRNLRIIPVIRGFRRYREFVSEINLARRTADHVLACLRGLHRDKFTFVFADWL